MTCSHSTYKAANYGSESECLQCGLPIIYTGKKWEWLYGISSTKAKALRKAHEIDRATAKHKAKP